MKYEMLSHGGGRGRRGKVIKGPLRKPFVFSNFEKPSQGPNAHIPASSDERGQTPDFKRLEKQEQVDNKSGQFADTPMVVDKHSANEGVTVGALTQYYCERCYKKLLGAKAYQAHMLSKEHKDELGAKGLLKWRSSRVTRSKVVIV